MYAKQCPEALRSLEGQRGAFDTPSDKIPPDLAGGSLGSVTGWPTSRSSSISSFDSDYSSSPSPSPAAKQVLPNIFYSSNSHQSKSVSNIDAPDHRFSSTAKSISSVPTSAPRNIPTGQRAVSWDTGSVGLATPPLTPDSSLLSDASNSATSLTQSGQDNAAQDFLVRLFPGSARTALPYSKSVRIASSELSLPSEDTDSFAFEGVVLELPNRLRTLYIDGKDAENVKLRERYVITWHLCCCHLSFWSVSLLFWTSLMSILSAVLSSLLWSGLVLLLPVYYTLLCTQGHLLSLVRPLNLTWHMFLWALRFSRAYCDQYWEAVVSFHLPVQIYALMAISLM